MTESGTPHHVDIVDGSGTHDTCSCVDFLTNDLGTCKHLEAVRRAIAQVRGLQHAFRGLPMRPVERVLTLQASGGLRLKTLGRWTEARLMNLGLRVTREGALEPIASSEPVALSAGRSGDQHRILHAAVQAAALLRKRNLIRERREGLRRAYASGSLSLDVLSVPLFPYQRDGAAHLLIAGRAILADDMGLGKTAQAIAACELLRARGEASRILVVTMASLKHQWAREIARFAGVPAAVVGGNPSARRQALESDAPYKVLNYELTWRELQALKRLDVDVIVFDEAQRAKNFRTKTARTIREIPSRFAFVLTGTPVENRLDDLYALMQVTDPEVLGPLWKFNLDFHEQGENGKVIGYKNLSVLRERSAPVVLRRRKEEILNQLPPLTEQTLRHRLHPAPPRRLLRRGPEHARSRLTLAHVVLEAGFPEDAVRAAHEALAHAIVGLLDSTSQGSSSASNTAVSLEHAALVAAIFGQLLPTGRLSAAAHGVLARLHDLTLLDTHGVRVDTELARSAVEDARAWVSRILGDTPHASASAGHE